MKKASIRKKSQKSNRKTFIRRRVMLAALIGGAGGLLLIGGAIPLASSFSPDSAVDGSRKATLYKNPQCSCCEAYADYLRDNGFEVTVEPTHDLSLIKRRHGVPEPLDGCHTMLVDGYVVEGHVPLKPLDRLLTERPDIKGVSLPGMPMGSPGMSGTKTEPFTIYELSDAEPRIYAVE